MSTKYKRGMYKFKLSTILFSVMDMYKYCRGSNADVYHKLYDVGMQIRIRYLCNVNVFTKKESVRT